ncbi:WYL domain-containing protein [Brevibacterium sp. ZH18]|uniref:helix-turn-helix transcriptional regulator n=1 Tax=Brevibacterium sp. ZH18 TaxID=2927784 RepID=UPI001F605976|nr:WYL domain-containing protein [Brevibacterium sp. ZH18]MCI4010448.1 WYL domain-containing protein [Brevibacterium sp. ZH18]
MRADRLLALVLFLQSRGKVTAAQVATELEVSLATARRDLEALSSAGIPVSVQPGRGGGWRLIGGARTNLTGLSSHEAGALFWMLGTAGLSDPATRVATRKLIRALPESLREEAETLATAIHYDHTTWGEVHRGNDANQAGDASTTNIDHLNEVRSALIDRKDIHIDYVRGNGVRATKTVQPLGLVAKAGTWYLVARLATGPDEPRTYRVDRIVEISSIIETNSGDASSPVHAGTTDGAGRRIADRDRSASDDFDLIAYWSKHVKQVEALRSSATATIRAPKWALPILTNHFGSYLSIISSEGDFTVAEVRANLNIALAEQLAGWGRQVEVLEPPELRRELARIGTELSSMYSGD